MKVEALASETRRYTIQVDVKAENNIAYVEVIQNGEIVTLYVDGARVGVKMWAPYCFDVAGMLGEGKHTVMVEVTDSMGKAPMQEVPLLRLVGNL